MDLRRFESAVTYQTSYAATLVLICAFGGVANHGDCGLWRRHPSSFGPTFGLRQSGASGGIRRRLNATARHLKATDYVGQASRRYRLHHRLLITDY